MARRAMLGAALALLAVTVLAGTISPATADPPLDTTVQAPSLTVTDVSVLGPSTVRVTANVNTANLDSTLYLRYGEGTVLDQRTPEVQISGGAQPNEVVIDLLDLEPGSSYNVDAVLGTPAGTVTSSTVPFTTPAAVYVNPTTGLAASSSAKRKTRCTIVGTARRERLVGTRKRDVICGMGGSDRITGRAGNDLILAGRGHDRASGGNGRDRLYGNSGRDRLRGGKGRDRVYGGPGRDWAKVERRDRFRSVERRAR